MTCRWRRLLRRLNRMMKEADRKTTYYRGLVFFFLSFFGVTKCLRKWRVPLFSHRPMQILCLFLFDRKMNDFAFLANYECARLMWWAFGVDPKNLLNSRTHAHLIFNKLHSRKNHSLKKHRPTSTLSLTLAQKITLIDALKAKQNKSITNEAI